MFARFLPFVALGVFLFFCLFWRAWLQYRRHGSSGIVLFRSGNRLQKMRDILFVALLFIATLQTVLFAVKPDWFAGLMMPIGSSLTGIAAVVVLTLGVLLTIAAQLGMGVSWRIGIDPEAKPGLVTGGLYQFCRNPIYLGMIITLIGLALALPTWFSLALVLGVFWCIRTQTIEEEAYLRSTYGDQFIQYAASVGRFVPGFGKLAVR